MSNLESLILRPGKSYSAQYLPLWEANTTTSGSTSCYSIIYTSSNTSDYTNTYYNYHDIKYTGWNTSYWDVVYSSTVQTPSLSPRQRIQQIIQSRISPRILVPRRGLLVPATDKESRARQTLRLLIGDQEYRKLLKNGFVSVRAKSGLVYTISPGHTFANVYRQGKLVERLCVQLRGAFTPTDSLIMRFLLITNDEELFRQKAIDHGAINVIQTPPKPDERSLVEIVENLRVSRAA